MSKILVCPHCDVDLDLFTVLDYHKKTVEAECNKCDKIVVARNMTQEEIASRDVGNLEVYFIDLAMVFEDINKLNKKYTEMKDRMKQLKASKSSIIKCPLCGSNSFNKITLHCGKCEQTVEFEFKET